LKFATGSVRLPIGGFKMLNPKLTIVKRELLSTYGMNSKYNEISQNYYLPSVMTCQNYLKIPEYTSYEMLTEKMNLAINEGGSEFHFS
jgi:E3 ubiquitin-protein ligase TRIP12